MSFGAGFKRARVEDFGPGFDPVPYGPPGDFGPPLGALAGAGLDAPLTSVGLGLGSGPDGQLPVVKLRGLPFSCGEQEVRMFLEVDTVDIVFVKRQGRFSGEAFVVLPGMLQVDFALGKHKAYLGKRYVEVQPALKEDYYKAVAAFISDGGLGELSARRPQQDNRADRLAGFGGGFSLNGAGAHQILPRGPLRDMPSRDFQSPRGARELSLSGLPPSRAFDRNGGLPDLGGLRTGRRETAILRLRGLPFSASREDVATWFNESGALSRPIDEMSVHLVLAFDGRPTGSAFVEFIDAREAENAMIRDKAMMGSRYVELFHSSREEVSQATAGAY